MTPTSPRLWPIAALAVLAAALGVLWFSVTYRALGIETAPEGWHDGQSNRPPTAWPSRHQPPAITPAGPWQTNIQCLTNIAGDVTNVHCATNQTLASITNLYRGYGTYTRHQTVIYTNWYVIVTNCVAGLTNGLAACTNGGVTGMTEVVTNYIGVSAEPPTNIQQGYYRRPDLLRPGRYLPWTNVHGGTPYSTNTWAAPVLLSDDTDELYRWPLLRGSGPYVGTNGVTNSWRTTPMAPAVLGGGVSFSPWDGLFGLYFWSLVSSNGAAPWTTNYWSTNALLTNTFIYYDGQMRTSQWTSPFYHTNILLNVRDVQQLDIRQAIVERIQVLPSSDVRFNATKLIYDWRAGVDQPTPSWSGYGEYYPGPRPVWQNCQASKQAVYWLAHQFVVPQMADTNGQFTTWFETPQDWWIWGTTNGVTTNWIQRWDDPDYFFATDVYHEDFPRWSSELRTNVWCDRWGGNAYTRCGEGDAELNLLEQLDLPHGYIITVNTQTVPGFTVGNLTQRTVSALVTNRSLYGSYFRHTPGKNFTALSSNYPGLGHIVTNTWTLRNIWTNQYRSYTTNEQGQWGLWPTFPRFTNNYVFGGNPMVTYQEFGWPVGWSPTNTLYGDGHVNITLTSRVYQVMWVTNLCYVTNGCLSSAAAVSNGLCIFGPASGVIQTGCTGYITGLYCPSSGLSNGVLVTNCVDGVTNGLPCYNDIATNVCGVHVEVLLDTGRVVDNGWWPPPTDMTNIVLLSTNYTDPVNMATVSTVITNWDVAEGYHEVDYGWDGVRTVLSNLVWTTASMRSWISNHTEDWQWAVSNTVPDYSNTLGYVASTNTPWNSIVPPGEFVFFPPAVVTNDGSYVVEEAWPMSTRLDFQVPTLDRYEWTNITIIYNAANDGQYSYQTNSGSGYWWPPNAPEDFIDECAVKHWSWDYWSCWDGYVWWSYSFYGPTTNILATCGDTGYGDPDATPMVGRVGAVAKSTALIWEQAQTNFSPTVELYVRSARADRGFSQGVDYDQWGNPQAITPYEIAPPMVRDNTESPIPIGTILTNIQKVAWSTNTETWYYYRVECQGPTSCYGDNTNDCRALPTFTVNAPCGYPYKWPCWDSVTIGLWISRGLLNDVFFGGWTNATVPTGFQTIEVTDVLCEWNWCGSPPTFQYCCVTNCLGLVNLYTELVWSGPLPANPVVSVFGFNGRWMSRTWMCEQRHDTNGLPLITNVFHVGVDSRPNETNYNVPQYPAGLGHPRIVKWDAGNPLGLRFDVTNNLGFFQAVGTPPTNLQTDLTFYEFIRPTISSNATTEWQLEGWSIDGGKVLYKWDTPNGFKYK